jgi:hypothetical protein
MSYSELRGTCAGAGYPAGTVVTQGGDLELGHRNSTVAVRFPQISLKSAAKIKGAFVLFDVDDITDQSNLNVTITIHAEATRSNSFGRCCTSDNPQGNPRMERQHGLRCGAAISMCSHPHMVGTLLLPTVVHGV